MKTCIVIPAYNEANRIRRVLEETRKFCASIIVVDDGSADRTYDATREIPGITLIRHRVNLGKGAALKTGCKAALRMGADLIIVMDADGQHRPENIPLFEKQIKEGGCDVVFGTRTIGDGMPLMMWIGNKFFSTVTFLLFGIRLSDTQCGYRAFRASIYHKIEWHSSQYSIETEMIVRVAQQHLKTGEVPIETIYHDRYKGTTVFDGIKIFLNMLKWKFL